MLREFPPYYRESPWIIKSRISTHKHFSTKVVSKRLNIYNSTFSFKPREPWTFIKINQIFRFAFSQFHCKKIFVSFSPHSDILNQLLLREELIIESPGSNRWIIIQNYNSYQVYFYWIDHMQNIILQISIPLTVCKFHHMLQLCINTAKSRIHLVG